MTYIKSGDDNVLELFFDNEKVFSVFERIIESEEEKVNIVEICYNLGIDPKSGAEIIQSFVYLGILEENEENLEKGIFTFNKYSPVVLGLCLFDEFIANEAMTRLVNKRDENNKESVENMMKTLFSDKSFDDFVEFIEKL